MYQPKMPKDIRCPLEYAMELFSGRWKSRILCMLFTVPSLRYGEIKKNLDTISDTVLTATLKEMMVSKLVERRQFEEVPPRVEYALTQKARELVPRLQQICKWGSQYHEPGDGIELQHCRRCTVKMQDN